MKYIREHRNFRLFWLLLALHFINGSIDPADFVLKGSSQEDLSINEIETIVEFVAEHMLGIEDCFPEHDEPYEDGNPVKPIKTLSQYLPNLSIFVVSIYASEIAYMKIYFEKYLQSQFSPEVISPPPKHIA